MPSPRTNRSAGSRPSPVDRCRHRDSLDLLDVPDPHRDGRAPVVLEAVTLLRQELGNESPVMCGVISAFTLAGQLRGEADMLMDLVIDPDFLKAILDKAVEWDVEYVRAAVEAGADIIVLVDATASGDITRTGAVPGVRSAIPAEDRPGGAGGGAKSIMHICGNTIAQSPIDEGDRGGRDRGRPEHGHEGGEERYWVRAARRSATSHRPPPCCSARPSM